MDPTDSALIGRRRPELTSFALHLLAMAFMLCDHLWAMVVPGNDWLTDIGRIAFPIFAFMTVEGYFHTKNFRKYLLRLFIFALISEIPFNLVMGGRLLYPLHQNVLWTFLLGLGLVWLNERVREKKLPLRLLVGIGTVILAYVLGIITFVDYYHAGVLTVLVFYFFRGRKWWCFAGQLLALWYINVEMLSGFAYELVIGGHTVFLVRQGFALLSLIPIWLYRGRQGPYNRGLRALYYGFYPVHLLVLWIIMRLV